ncbi:MAG: cytochrome c biogenesis protein CcsA [Deltaproteobacteria bacterium]|nr:cytochrome c biogenesis protein CcsA [Deltaproteobacteria bacterium]
MSALRSLLSVAPGVPIEPTDILDDKFGQLRSLPMVGTWGLYSVIAAAGITFAIALAASRRPQLLAAARNAAYATSALVLFDLLLLAYAFITHDFRIRYVARYSDRSMSTGYLITALWGGQDGSLLWWLSLLAANTAACVAWMKSRWRELQPYVIATLIATLGFFAVIMAFSANPFAESIAGARADGEGLNPLLQNFYMIIHPPSLYMGFVGCAVPFAFAVAAMASGRLDEEWLYAVRKWMLFAWLFLSIGNVLGMLWAYEELGWGGYWAWDPVENAAFMPWLTASAFVHSTMIQERRRMLKIWNVALISQTFFMTIWGTFLTRSGMIKSVHAFAQSSIGIYFTYLMVTVACVTAALIVYRLPELKSLDVDSVGTRKYRASMGPLLTKILLVVLAAAVVIRFQSDKMAPIGALAVLTVQGLAGLGMAKMRRVYSSYPWGDYTASIALFVLFLPFTFFGCIVYWVASAVSKDENVSAEAEKKQQAIAVEIDSVFSREAAFVANNWVLLAMQGFVGITTAYPLISTAISGEEMTVGPRFYNTWMVPLGLILFALMGIGPLLGWRKTSKSSLRKAFEIPLIVTLSTAILHIVIGHRLGFPWRVESDPIYPTTLGLVLAKMTGLMPILASSLAAFNVAVLVQEYSRGVAARKKVTPDENVFASIWNLVAKQRRRYGGYIVHAGIVLMFVGFTGAAYRVDREVALRTGESVEVEGYKLTYLGPRRVDSDPAKMEIYTDLKLEKNGKYLGEIHPARFIYRRQQMPTSEVAIRVGPREDVYIAPGSVNAETGLATLHVYINPLTAWIWLGSLILIFGAIVAMWPEPEVEEVGVSAYLRTAGAVAWSLAFGLMIALTPARVHAQTSSTHAGDVHMKSPEERKLFSNLLCMCGTCDRLPLSACACGWAEDMRNKLGARLSVGETIESITSWYVKEHGAAALNVPRSRSVWLVPTILVGLGAIGAVFVVRGWTRKGATSAQKAADEEENKAEGRDDYDSKLDDELSDQ